MAKITEFKASSDRCPTWTQVRSIDETNNADWTTFERVLLNVWSPLCFLGFHSVSGVCISITKNIVVVVQFLYKKKLLPQNICA